MARRKGRPTSGGRGRRRKATEPEKPRWLPASKSDGRPWTVEDARADRLPREKEIDRVLPQLRNGPDRPLDAEGTELAAAALEHLKGEPGRTLEHRRLRGRFPRLRQHFGADARRVLGESRPGG